METKLGLFCDKLIEAGWLAALIIIPLFFNFYNFSAFELTKVSLVRSIALVMAAAWVVKTIEVRGQRARTEGPAGGLRNLLSSNPLAVATALLVVVQLLTTVTSVVPRTSFWGAYPRPQGTYTLLSYVVIFLLILLTLRTRRQAERIVTVILLASLPVSLYGLVQHYGLEFLPGTFFGTERIASTQGNPIFLGAYLIMVIPITLAQVVESLSAVRQGLGSRMLVVCYLLVLALQLVCLLFTQSRGPVLGLAIGLWVFVLLLSALREGRRLALAASGVAVGLILFVIVFNLPNTPLSFLNRVPYIRVLGLLHTTPSMDGRLWIWQGATDMITADPWRTLVGYGPDSLFWTYNPFYPLELTRYELGERPDRLHNQVLEVLATKGLLGLAAYLFLFSSLFYYGLKSLGFVGTRRAQAVFVSLWLAGGVLGVLGARFVDGTWRLAGVGLMLGLMTALVAYLVVHALFLRARRESTNHWRQIMLTALLSALVAHFVETQTGIAVAATLTYFWIYAALLAGVGRFLVDQRLAKPREVSASTRPSDRGSQRRARSSHADPGRSSEAQAPSLTIAALMIGLILMTMGFDFITLQFQFAPADFVAIGLIVVVWILGFIIIAVRANSPGMFVQGGKGQGPPWLRWGLVSWGWFAVFMGPYVIALRRGSDVSYAMTLYYFFLAAGMVALAIALIRGEGALPRLTWRSGTWWAYPILVIGAVVLIYSTNFKTVKADIYYKAGTVYRRAGKYDESITLYHWALELTPNQDRYYLAIGLDSMAKMSQAQSPEQQASWFEESRKALQTAMQINPLDPDHPANLGTLYLRWESMATTSAERIERLQKAIAFYEQARRMSPYHHGVRLKEDLAQAYLLLGDVYVTQGVFDRAIPAYEAAGAVDPENYVSHKSLALVHQQLGQIDAALSEARLARELAPKEEKTALTDLIVELERKRP